MSIDPAPQIAPPAAEPRRGWLARLFRRGPVVPVVRLHGTISAEPRPGRINVAGVTPLLRRAFAMRSAPAVAIVINSPGGSAVQSRLVSKLIRDLADEHDKQVLVFVEDVAASGGYFIAVAGDEIIADPSSVVGSIGVIFSSFGFHEAIAKLGVERRVYTAGRNKSMLDPFMPAKQEDIERLKSIELDVHDVFIGHVKARRGDKLKAAADELFTGEWWTGVRGLELGLVDRLGDMHAELRRRFGAKVRLRPIAPKRPLLTMPRFGLGDDAESRLAAAADQMLARIEDRALWSRFGL